MKTRQILLVLIALVLVAGVVFWLMRSPPPPAPVVVVVEGNATVGRFAKAKRILPGIFEGEESTFYCGCRYVGKEIDMESCGFEPRKNAKRASRLEWEHVVPAKAFGGNLPAWKVGDPRCLSSKGKAYKGRRCAGKASEAFKFMEADLYNLRPSIGEVNGDRSSRQMAEIPGEERSYGACDFEVGKKVVEPREGRRGDVARTYLYMDAAYPDAQILDATSRAMFESWSETDPVDEAELRWAERVQQVQGNINPFIKP